MATERQDAKRTVRSCAVCREKLEKRRLLRFVWLPPVGQRSGEGSGKGKWQVDAEALLPGRGIYLHPELRCLTSKKLPGVFAQRVAGGRPSKSQDRGESRSEVGTSKKGERQGGERSGRTDSGFVGGFVSVDRLIEEASRISELANRKPGANALVFRKASGGSEKIGAAALREVLKLLVGETPKTSGPGSAEASKGGNPHQGGNQRSGKRIRL